jgi:hypothetical protein
MKTPLRWILLLILLFSLPTLACETLMGAEESADDDSTQPQATVATDSNQETVAATATPASDTTDTTESDDSQDSSDTTESDDSSDEVTTDNGDTGDAPAVFSLTKVSDTLKDFSSYRLLLVYQFEGSGADGSAVTQSLTGEVGYISEPAANSLHLTMDGFVPGMTGPQEVAVVQTADQVYTLAAGAPCVAVSADQFSADMGNSFAELANPDTFLGSLEGAELAGSGEINGVEALHYTFDESDITQSASQFDSLTGNIYVAQDGGYVVKLEMEGTGSMAGAAGMQNGTIRLTLDVLDVNQSFEITAPEGCDAALDVGDIGDIGGGDVSASGYPTLDDAFEIVSFEDTLTYKTNKTFDEAVQFYRDQMAAAGWQPEGTELIAQGTAVLQFVHSDGRKVTLAITGDPTTGAQQVVITPTP